MVTGVMDQHRHTKAMNKAYESKYTRLYVCTYIHVYTHKCDVLRPIQRHID